MKAIRWIGGMSLALALASGVFASTAQASVDGGGDPISGVDGRNAPVMVNPEQLAAWRLERLGARVKYDESKIDRPVIEVDLSGRPVSDETLKELLPLRHLRALNLRGTRVTDKGLKTLARIQNLHHLNLCDTPLLSHASIVRLREAIPFLSITVGCWSGQSIYLPPSAVVP